MKNPLYAALSGSLVFSAPAAAQSAGRLSYEVTRHLDMSKAKMVALNQKGEPINIDVASSRLDGPGGAVELPGTTSHTMSLRYAGGFAKEERDDMAPRVMMMGGNGADLPKLPSFKPPYTQQRYLNLAARTRTTIVTINDTSYALPGQLLPAPPAGWHDLPQTKKIAGYECHKVTVPYNKLTYTLWVTTELPFTYSPVADLTPAKGVVLALSSDQEQYTATAFNPEAVAEAAVRPAAHTRPVTEAQLAELRRRAEADLQRKLMENLTGAQH